MEIVKVRCPYCGCICNVEIKARVDYKLGEATVILAFFMWLKGIEPHRGYFKKLDQHTYEFSKEIYSDSKVKTWLKGEFVWYPGIDLEFTKIETVHKKT